MKKSHIAALFSLLFLVSGTAGAREIRMQCPSLAAILAHNNMHLEDWVLDGSPNWYNLYTGMDQVWLSINQIKVKSKQDAIKRGYYILQHASQHGVLLNDPSAADGDRECVYITPDGYYLKWKGYTASY